jgi:hypothetical protein
MYQLWEESILRKMATENGEKRQNEVAGINEEALEKKIEEMVNAKLHPLVSKNLLPL